MKRKSPFKDFPIGQMDPVHLAGRFTADCALIGGLIIAWGQFDNELCNLLSRLLGFSHLKPADERAHAIFYSSVNAKARRDTISALIKTVDDELCREWLSIALEKVAEATDKRNNIIHSEYFAHLQDPSDSHMLQIKPATKQGAVKREGIRHQIESAITALKDARFYMEFAYAATRGRKDLEETLELYEPALRARREREQSSNPRK